MALKNPLRNTKIGDLLGIPKSSNNATSSITENLPLTLPSSTYISTAKPVWKNLSELIYLLNCYYDNPIVQAIINIKAEAFANMKFHVKDLKTKDVIPLEDYEADNGKLYDLLRQPNPLQSTFEWLRQFKVNREVFGNAYMYASVPVGWENNFTYQDITVINNLPPYCMAPVLTGQWLDATKKEDIISRYELSYFNGKKRILNPNTILHLNDVNVKFDQNFTQGQSDLLALKMPITNIEKAYESRNVLITKRGALGILTSEMKDEAMGSLPLEEDQVEQVQKAFEKYGLMNDQYSQIISPMPLKYQKMAMSVKELMLFEEIESDAIAIAVSKGVPELLVKYYVKGGTFNNLDASEKRLYDSTIIPESKDDLIGLNNFLKTKKHGIELIGSYNHLNILQDNKKEEAETNKINSEIAEKAFRTGAVTYNVYLLAMGLPEDNEIGKKRIWDLSKEQLAAINNVNSRNDLNNGNK